MGKAAPVSAPCGGWKSPITSDLIVGESTPIDEIAVFGDDIYWTERRPRENGRTVLVRRSADGRITDLTPAPFNVRTRVHEYGGGAFSVSPLGIFVCSFDDQRLYRLDGDGRLVALTHATGMRYADAVPDPAHARLVAVREDHSNTQIEAVNTRVGISIAAGDEQVLASGHDFYSTPTVSPDGRELAWLTWDHIDLSHHLWSPIDHEKCPCRLAAHFVQPLLSRRREDDRLVVRGFCVRSAPESRRR